MKALLGLSSSVTSTSRSELISRWLLAISAEVRKIVHRPGKLLIIPDTLSWAHKVQYKEEDKQQTSVEQVFEKLRIPWCNGASTRLTKPAAQLDKTPIGSESHGQYWGSDLCPVTRWRKTWYYGWCGSACNLGKMCCLMAGLCMGQLVIHPRLAGKPQGRHQVERLTEVQQMGQLQCNSLTIVQRWISFSWDFQWNFT